MTPYKKVNRQTSAIASLSVHEALSGWGLPAFCLAAVLLIFGSPLLVAFKEDATLIPSTRTQFACLFVWLIPIAWGGMCISTIGASQRVRGLTLFWRSMGVSDFWRFLAIWFPFGIISVSCSALAAFVYMASYASGDISLSDTFLSSTQFAFLAFTIQTGFLLLTLGLSSVISSTAAFFITFSMYLYCLYGITLIGFCRTLGTTSPKIGVFTDLLWACSPQLRLGDLTTRLVFNWGPMPFTDFWKVAVYCTIWSTVFSLFGYAMFKRGKSSSVL